MTGSRRFRLLSADEIELWRAVAQTVEPRPGSILPPTQREVAPKRKPEPDKQARVPVSPGPAIPPARRAQPPLAPLERQYRKKVARGLIGIERVLDLHGLTQADAHAALRGFLRGAQLDDLRLVLVVTGKGRSTAASAMEEWSERGILRRGVPHWLREADLRPVVLGFEEASQPHGGAGALYVRLRARRG